MSFKDRTVIQKAEYYQQRFFVDVPLNIVISWVMEAEYQFKDVSINNKSKYVRGYLEACYKRGFVSDEKLPN